MILIVIFNFAFNKGTLGNSKATLSTRVSGGSDDAHYHHQWTSRVDGVYITRSCVGNVIYHAASYHIPKIPLFKGTNTQLDRKIIILNMMIMIKMPTPPPPSMQEFVNAETGV